MSPDELNPICSSDAAGLEEDRSSAWPDVAGRDATGATALETGELETGEVSSFIGREGLVATAVDLLCDPQPDPTRSPLRLLTLRGPGGVGKTRLMRRVVARVRDRQVFPQGVILVSLVGITDDGTGAIAGAICRALDVHDNAQNPQDALFDYVRSKRLLLVLDNCEHVATAVARLVRLLLRVAPGLQVVATSRGDLGAEGEWVLDVPPLCVGDTAACDCGRSDEPARERADPVADAVNSTDRGDGDPVGVDTADTEVTRAAPPWQPRSAGSPVVHTAVRLLRDRALAVGAAIGDEELPAAQQLCRLVGGLPLGIELAARWLGAVPVGRLVDIYDPRLLGGGAVGQDNQDALVTTLDWTATRQLSEPERQAWAVLSVFAGGEFDLDAAVAVLDAMGVMNRRLAPVMLASLLRQSILNLDRRYHDAGSGAHGPRYEMLPPIHHYGQTMAGAPREHDNPPPATHSATNSATSVGSEFYRRARDAHAAYYEDLVARCAEGYYSTEEARWMQRMRLDRQNIRLAVTHLLRPDPGLPADARRACRTRGRRMVIAYAASRAAIHQGDLGPMRALLHMALTDETLTGETSRPDVPDPDVLDPDVLDPDVLDPDVLEPDALDVVALALEAWIAAIQGDPGEAQRLLARAEAVFTGLVEAGACRAEDPPWVLPYAQATSLWLTGSAPGNIQRAFGRYEQAERLARPSSARGSAGDAYMVLLFHAMAAAFHSDPASTAAGSTVAGSSVTAATALAQRVRTEAAQSGAEWAISWSLWVSGLVELRHGDPRRALTLAQQALAGQEAIGDMWGPAWSLWLIALCLLRLHEYHRAAAVFGCAAAAQHRAQGDINGLGAFLALQRAEEAAARRGLAAHGRGRDEWDELVSYWRVVALDARTSDTGRIWHLAHDPPAATTALAGLTRRQAQVARLRAAGLTRKEIMDRLGVARTTLDKHLADIKKRTGVNTPEELDAWLRAAEATPNTTSNPTTGFARS